MERISAPKRLLAIGDIHGYRDKLCRLLNKVQPGSDDQVVFLGDYIDRGPQSRQVIEELLSFRRSYPETVFLRGNHEQMLLDALAFEDLRADRVPHEARERMRRELEARLWTLSCSTYLPELQHVFRSNGGGTTLESYGGYGSIPEEHRTFFEELLLMHRVTPSCCSQEGAPFYQPKEFVFVHAGIRPKVPLERQDPMDLLWIREDFTASNARFGGRVIVHGHTRNSRVPGKAPQRICVDSGVDWSGPVHPRSRKTWGKLTCCDVLTREIWQA